MMQSICYCQVKWRCGKNDVTNGGYSTENLQQVFGKVGKFTARLL